MIKSKTTFDSVFINGQSLRPAPYVSTNYEYNKSGEYVIGGFLIVTLTGTIVGEDIAAKINELSALQTLTNCVSITIGCSGGTDFLNGAGRIRAVTINPSDQPYLASYSMQLALETVDGKPAVEADEEFLRQTCFDQIGKSISFLQNYNETLSVVGEGSVIASVDGALQVSKSYIKASGKISMASFMREICGIPEYDGIKNSIDILRMRAKALMSMQACIPDSPLAQFSGWNKWLDTKTLTVNADGSVDWTFDVYLNKGSAMPIAWIDITTEDQQNQRQKNFSKNISGTIRGLSSANIEDYLADRVNVNERIQNAQTAYSALSAMISSGGWPSDNIALSGEEKSPESEEEEEEDNEDDKNCAPDEDSAGGGTCLDRISSTVKTSIVSGEISFNAEFGPVDACKQTGIGTIEKSKEEDLPAARHIEYIIPGAGNSLVIDIGAPTPSKTTIVVRGTLNSCELTVNNRETLIGCVNREFNLLVAELDGVWIGTNETKTYSTYSYARSKSFIKCEG